MMQKGGLEIHHLSVEQYSDYCEEKSDANSSYTKLMFLFQKNCTQSKSHLLCSMKLTNYEHSVYISYYPSARAVLGEYPTNVLIERS